MSCCDLQCSLLPLYTKAKAYEVGCIDSCKHVQVLQILGLGSLQLQQQQQQQNTIRVDLEAARTVSISVYKI